MSQDGEYESEIRNPKKGLEPKSGVREKRLLSAMKYGCLVTYNNGHRWLYSFHVDEMFHMDNCSLDDMLRAKGLPVMRSKVYGTIDDALDRIDGALKVLGMPSLFQTYEDYPEGWG